MTTFEHGMIESHVSSPARERELKDALAKDINAMMQNAGVEIDAPLEIDIDKTGKLSIKNMPESKFQRQLIDIVLAQINNMAKTPNPETDSGDNAEWH